MWDNLNNLSILIAILIGIASIIGIITGFFKKFWKWIRKIFISSSATFDIPKKTIIIVPQAHRKSTWWHMGRSGDKPAMQISGDFTVTNITKSNILLTVAKMKKPKALGHVMVKDLNSQYHGSYYIPSGATTKLTFDFWIIPPIKEVKQNFTADIAIVDQFGNEHWIKKVEFKYS